jgi:hypothetical protein
MVSYLVMATGLGISFVPIHNHGAQGSVVHLFREVYFARTFSIMTKATT